MALLAYLAVGALIVIALELTFLVAAARSLALNAAGWSALAITYFGPDVVAAAKEELPPHESAVDVFWMLILTILLIFLTGSYLALGVWYALGWLRAAP
jgi:hypothetical protein